MWIEPPFMHSAYSRPVFEQKFVLSPALAGEVRAWAREHMGADPNGQGPNGDEYAVESLYLDTTNFDVLRRSGSFGRAKYRIRRYGSSETVFLERKMKADGLISKRRTIVSLTELPLLNGATANRRRADFWFHRRVLARQLQPVCQIRYSRTARIAATDRGTMRLTMDDAISACLAQGMSFEAASDPVAISEGQVILEMKYRGTAPAMARTLIETFALEPRPSSKYRKAGALLGFTSDLIALHESLQVEVPQFA